MDVSTRAEIPTYEKVDGKWRLRQPYSPPVAFPPLIRGEALRIDLARGVRSGKVTNVAVYRLNGEPYALPSSAKSMVKALVSALPSDEPRAIEWPGPATHSPAGPAYALASLVECRVTLARGYALTNSGEMKRKIIWEHSTTGGADVTDDSAQKATRKQIGHEEPEPVDSILVRGIWRDPDGRLERVLAGWWTDGSYDHGLDWVRTEPTLTLTAAQLSSALKEVNHG